MLSARQLQTYGEERSEKDRVSNHGGMRTPC